MVIFLPLREHFTEPVTRDTHPALEALLSKGRTRTLSVPSQEAALLSLFELSSTNEYPCAALSARADGIDVGNDYWLRADPIHLQAQRDDLIPFEITDLDPPHAVQLVESINTFWRDDGVQLILGATHRWYVRLPRAPELITEPISGVLGKPMGAHLPMGGQASHWMQKLTEVQMLLHMHTVNEERESAGQLSVNGLWLWGGGRDVPIHSSPFDTVYANDALSIGLAKASNTKHLALAENFAALSRTQHVLVVLDDTNIDMLEHQWFEPLLKALRRRDIAQCELVLWCEGAWRVHLTPSDLWRFWRRSTLLTQLQHG